MVIASASCLCACQLPVTSLRFLCSMGPGGFLGDLLLTPARGTEHALTPKMAQSKALPGIEINY